MAKFIFVTILVAFAAVAVMAAPAEESALFEDLELNQESEALEGQEIEEDHLRFRRVTCDLLTYGGVVGDSACAANCLSMGKAGGRCNDGVCQCRRTKIKDLWNQRFG